MATTQRFASRLLESSVVIDRSIDDGNETQQVVADGSTVATAATIEDEGTGEARLLRTSDRLKQTR